jgi:hypothetical protein
VSGNRLRIAAGVVVVALAVLLFVVLRASDDESTMPSDAGGKVPTIVVDPSGEPQGGIRELTYFAGEPIRFRVRSDVADEIHFHGYDVGKDVEAGGSVSFNVPATIEGIFEVELENAGEQIAEVTVEP